MKVTLVGHSMGGLVSRLALLQKGNDLPFVKRLIMLGTPNHGTLHTGRLGLLAHMSREATGTLWSVCASKKGGIKQLTEIGSTLKPYRLAGGEARTYHVEYVTIPGLFYHEDTGPFRTRSRGQSAGLQILNWGFELTKALPFWTARMKKPHDGIVEENSVFMGTAVATRFSERSATCDNIPERGAYAHVVHEDHKEADHVTIQSTDMTATITAEILMFQNLNSWKNKTKGTPGYRIIPL